RARSVGPTPPSRRSLAPSPPSGLPPPRRHPPLAHDLLATDTPQAILEVDRDADMVGHDADAVADARAPVGVGEVEDPVFFGGRTDADVGAVEERAVPRRAGRADLFAGEGLGAGVDDGLPRDSGADHGREDRVGAVVPCAGADERRRPVVKDVGAGPDL